MHVLIFRFTACLAILLVFSVAGFAQGKSVTGKYQNVEVRKFDIKDDVTFPPATMDVAMSQIVEELTITNKFKKVSLSATQSTEAMPESLLRLSGTITKFKPGSRTKRWVVGMGAGMTELKARITFVDAATGVVLFEKEIDGKVIFGFFGGDSNGASRRLAKEIASIVKKKFA